MHSRPDAHYHFGKPNLYIESQSSCGRSRKQKLGCSSELCSNKPINVAIRRFVVQEVGMLLEV